jgi:dTMP kinase
VAGYQGLFITFEGGDGSGKSTQARLLAERLRDEGYPVVRTFEPGGTSIGVALRELLLNARFAIKPLTELLVFEAARAENVETVIKPALRRGDIVICDRFTDSSIAYQGYGKDVPLEKIEGISKLVTNGVVPSITFLLDIEPRLSLQRLAEAGGDRIGGHLQLGFDMADQFDGHKRHGGWEVEVHEKIRQGYLDLANQEPERWRVINATLPQKRIANMIWNRLEPLLCSVQRRDDSGTLFNQHGQPN